ncbi:MAG: SDR family oxidoreductase, partial [Litorimonas sp.]
MNDTDFSGKTVLVIGGSSGIGNGMAQAFRSRGADVHVWGTRADAADYDGVDGSDLAGLHYSRVDVSDRAAIDAHDPGFDGLDVLICCQGIVRYGREEFARDGWDAVMAVNLDSVMDCAVKFKSLLAGAQGSLIIVSSVAGFSAAMGNPAYAASKAGAVSLTKSLGEAWARDGIRVNGIAPGLVATKLTEVTTGNEARMKASLRAIPLR